MIARIKGTLIHKTIGHVIVDAHGIGYRVFIPLSTFYELPDTGQAVMLNIHTHVKEDAIHLFGFYKREDQDVFQMLISVAGIGPKLALNILSGIPAAEFLGAITQGNLSRLIAIPGVGRKTAERMIVELKDRILKMELKETRADQKTDAHDDEAMKEDALSALVNLGYKSALAKNAIDRIIAASSEKLSLDVLLKQSLKALSG
jgi:Holliday junction DNA helicase RuvA